MSRKALLTGVLIVVAFLTAGMAGAYGGYALARSMFGSEWLREQAADVEDRARVLRQLRSGDVEGATELLERRLDADLIAMAVDSYIRADAIQRIRMALDTVRAYRTAYPRETSSSFIDENVARRLAGELTDDPAEQ